MVRVEIIADASKNRTKWNEIYARKKQQDLVFLIHFMELNEFDDSKYIIMYYVTPVQEKNVDNFFLLIRYERQYLIL